MKEIIMVWKDTKNVVLIAVSAAVYAASLIPFKVLVIIPGSTELRPGAVFPVVLGLLFGPAGAWGSAIGNTIADIFGMFGPGSIPGFAGNFLFAYVPFKLWNRLGVLSSALSPDFRKPKDIVQYMCLAVFGSLACALIIGWGVDFMGLVPFPAITTIIMINNTIVSIVLGPFLMAGLFNRLKKWGMVYDDFSERSGRSSLQTRAGIILAVTGIIGGIIAGFVLSAGTGFHGYGLSMGVLPFIILMIFGIILI